MNTVILYHAVPPPPPSRGEKPTIRDAHLHRRLRTYRGGGQVGGAETTGTQVGRPLPDAHRESPGVTAVALGGISRDNIRTRGAWEKGQRRGGGQGGGVGADQVRAVGGVGAEGLLVRIPQGGGDLAGGGPNPKREWWLPRHRSRGGGVEGSGGDHQ